MAQYICQSIVKNNHMSSSHQRIVGFIFFISTLVACRCVAQINPNVEKGQVNVGNVTIAYESQGSYKAPAILLIAGTNMQLTGWPTGFCQQLVSRGYRVIRFDNRDVGLSTKFDQLGLPDWAAIGKALAEKRDLLYPTHSMTWPLTLWAC
ncbi:alpha/beta fold hydrolase [Spirosoma sp. KNUC1025]|uniref:alpha/beta fold hydrolase n=1 Tax=Spirosoma sp. KNUC1025 TaxID=2894082 RepID=UPI001E3FC6C0|nr:alpha/beta hydrolase [Spirosoma sp. KNUC1025]UFH57903.1 hypothetical protein LN737_31590 [Spirosoma sp. KNUC1025]